MQQKGVEAENQQLFDTFIQSPSEIILTAQANFESYQNLGGNILGPLKLTCAILTI